MIEHIEILGKKFAIIIPADYEKNGIEFHSDPNDSLQIGSMMWKSGHHIQGHKHLSHPRSVEFSNEAIFITKGKVKINFLDDLGQTIAFLCQMPRHVCINELTISPTWHRRYIADLGIEEL